MSNDIGVAPRIANPILDPVISISKPLGLIHSYVVDRAARNLPPLDKSEPTNDVESSGSIPEIWRKYCFTVLKSEISLK